MQNKAVLIRRAVRRGVPFAAIAVTILSIVTSNIPWGSKDGFHGSGFPISGVMWDRADRYSSGAPADQFLDFPNPYAIIMNPLLFLILLSELWAAVELVLYVWIRNSSITSESS